MSTGNKGTAELNLPDLKHDLNKTSYGGVHGMVVGFGMIYAVCVGFAIWKWQAELTTVTFVTTCLLFAALTGVLAFTLPYLMQVTKLYPTVEGMIVLYDQLEHEKLIAKSIENIRNANNNLGLWQTAVAKLKGGYGSMQGITGYAKEALVAKEVFLMALILAQKAQNASGVGNLPDFSKFKI